MLTEGDFFEPFQRQADTVVMASVLHDWADTDAERILRQCTAALEPGGRVLLIERAPDAAETPDTEFTTADLLMFTALGGRERTRQEWAKLAAASGLRLTSVSAPLDQAGKRLIALDAADPRPL